MKNYILYFLFFSFFALAQNNYVFERSDRIKPLNKIDFFVLKKLKEKGIKPARLSSDAVFLRRVYLDVIGALPSEKEVRDFLSDKTPNKRSRIISKLLSRPDFSDYQSLHWCDILRIKSEFPIKLWPNAVQAYYEWIHTAIEKNMAYDKFAYEMLTSSGSNFRKPQVNFYRAVQEKTPRGIAAAVSLTFMGVRFDKLTEKQQREMEKFFSRVAYKKTEEWKEEIVYNDFSQTNVIEAELPNGHKVKIFPDEDPRKIFAKWLVSPNNKFFAKTAVNRIWAWLFGRGIINPPDDITTAKPVNKQLLSFLEKELIKSDFNSKHIYKIILNSWTYQQSSIPCVENANAEKYFACYPVRRLEAEVLIDMINQITGKSENYYSMVPEPFTFIPFSERAINLSDGTITSPFLEMFGRPSRDTGYFSERNNKPTPAQRLHFLNSTHIQKKINQSRKLREILKNRGNNPEEKIRRIYLNILSRYPTKEEIQTIKDYINEEDETPIKAMADVIWSLINSKEFLCRH